MSHYKINDFAIDWQSSDSHYFFDPSHPEKERLLALADKLPFFAKHVALLSSSLKKAVFVSKEASLQAAAASNRRLKCQKGKLWLVPLPLFHVAGLAVMARAFAGGYNFAHFEPAWQAKAFHAALLETGAAYTSLVPLQVYDLVRHGLRPPQALEFALVGGGALSGRLYKKGRALGWPLLPTYGSTEAFSQIATAERASLKSSNYPQLKLLPHMEARVKAPASAHTGQGMRKTAAPPPLSRKPLEAAKRLEPPHSRHKPPPPQRQARHIGAIEVRSPALLTAYYEIAAGRLTQIRKGEWFRTGDLGEVRGRHVALSGREDDAVKVKGRLMRLSALTARVLECAQIEAEASRAKTSAKSSGAQKGQERGAAASRPAGLRPAGLRAASLGQPPPRPALPRSAPLGSAPPGSAPLGQFLVIAVKDERAGHALALVTDCPSPQAIFSVLRRFNRASPAYERLRSVYIVPKLPLSAVGKPDREALSKALLL